MSGADTSSYPEAYSDHKTLKEPDTPSSCVADPEGVLVSVRSSSYWEVLTTPDATFFAVAMVARETRAGVDVLGGTYSGSCSLLEPITSRAEGATHFESPRE